MIGAQITTLILVYWLIVALPYWILSHLVQTLTNLEYCFGFTKYKNSRLILHTLNVWHNKINNVCKTIGI